VSAYRICHNTAPHYGEWWTVEKSRRGLFGRVIWDKVQNYYWVARMERHWPSEASAQAWIDEDRKPARHTCKAVHP